MTDCPVGCMKITVPHKRVAASLISEHEGKVEKEYCFTLKNCAFANLCKIVLQLLHVCFHT
jgi:hypothetical protein